MSRRIPDAGLAQTMTWIWLGMLVAGTLIVLLYRLWRKRHPRRPPEVVPGFSQRLQQRLTERRLRETKHRRRKADGGSPPPAP
jgi:hypothetical protein